MKAQEGVAVPTPPGDTPARAQTGDRDGKVVATEDDFGELNEATDRSPVADEAGHAGPDPRGADAARGATPASTPRRDLSSASVARERRPTVLSAIPAQLAKSMMGELREAGTSARMHAEPTRPVTDPSGPIRAGASPSEEVVDTYSVELLDDDPELSPEDHVRSLVDRARTLMENGNLGGAVIAADQTLAEAAKTPQPEVADLIKAARPLFDRIFTAYVGLLGQVPVRLRSDADLVGQELGDRTKYLLSHIDGKQTLEELSTSTGIPPVEAMKIAASLLAAGIVRV
jgi:hypothetical protein